MKHRLIQCLIGIMIGAVFSFALPLSAQNSSVRNRQAIPAVKIPLKKLPKTNQQDADNSWQANLAKVCNKIDQITHGYGFQTMKKFREAGLPNTDICKENLLIDYGTAFNRRSYKEAFKKLLLIVESLRFYDRSTLMRVDLVLGHQLNWCAKQKGKNQKECIQAIFNPGIIIADLLGWQSAFQKVMQANAPFVLPAAVNYPATAGLFCINLWNNKLEKYTVGRSKNQRGERRINNALGPVALLSLSLIHPESRLDGLCSCSEIAINGFICNPENPCLPNDPLEDRLKSGQSPTTG